MELGSMPSAPAQARALASFAALARNPDSLGTSQLAVCVLPP
ncbi:hypothetical protein P3T29_000127 [Kitasatospora sp. MAP5-34]|nr:hypothetical protein [Kitasatospora sp. MAP5-34]